MSGMLAAALLLAWIPFLPAHASSSAKQYSVSIRRGSLQSALDQFSTQTGLQIGAKYRSQEDGERLVGPVEGTLTAEAVLEQLLAGSGLSFAKLSEDTIRVYATVIESISDQNVTELLVTGTRLSGGEEGPAPVRVIGQQRIGRYGVSTVSNLARYFTQQPFSFGDGYLPSGAQYFQIRGLGFDTTLVLINGRRTSASANSISFNAFDLNTVPLTAVDRIEVLSDSASAIYGADAIGGVVNIILKQKIEEPEVFLHYGGGEGGATERRIALSLGDTIGRLNASLVVDYFEHDPLTGEDLDLWRNQDFRRFGGQDFRVPTANPGNVYSLTGRPLPGLPTAQAGIPRGSTGVGLTSADFLPTAGIRNLESPFRYKSLSAETNRASAYTPLEFKIASNLSIFGELLVADSTVVSQVNFPSIARVTVPATNPFNPFGEAVAVDTLFAGMKPIEQVARSELVRWVSGARGSLRGWESEVAAVHSHERVSVAMLNNINPARVQAAVNSTDPQTALNLFRDGPAGSDELLTSLVGDPRILGYSSGSTQVSGFVRGPLVHLPAGTSEFVLGGEWRRESARFFDTQYVSEDRDISSAFAELKVPVLDKLALSLALRRDQYDSIGDTWNPLYGVVWRPGTDWLLRASYGTSFRPPSLFDLYSPRREVVVPVADPRRGGVVSNVVFNVGGNPDLDVVTARSLTSGFVFAPQAWPGLRLSSSYWRITMDNRITAPLFNDIVRSEHDFLDRITRAEPTAEDIIAGRPGALQAVNITRMNFGRLETSGVDFDVAYQIETRHGVFNPTLAVTWVHDYSAKDMPSVLPANRVGIAYAGGTIPEWRLVGTLAWKLGGFGASATATYTPAYQDSNLAGLADRQLSSRTLLDLQASLELGTLFGENSLFSNAKLTAGALNLFDKAPDFAEAGLSIGYDVSQADMTQRFVYLRLSKSF